MTVADISMSYDSVIDFADTVESTQLDFRDFLLALDAFVESLDGVWEGKAKDEFDSAYQKVRKKLSVSNESLEEFGIEVKKTSKRQKDADQASATKISRALPFGVVSGGAVLKSNAKLGSSSGSTSGSNGKTIAMPHIKNRGSVLGDVTSAKSASGELIGGSYDISPSSVKAEGHLAEGQISGAVGVLSGTLLGSVGKVEAKGNIGATLFNKEGKFTPNLGVKAEAEATGIEGEAKGQIGSSQYNIHGKASGKALTASASAKAEAGVIAVEDDISGERITTYGASAEVGAEAYAVSGKVSAGITVFGVKIDGSVSGHAGGAGVKAGGEVYSKSASGELGAGLGLGAGIKVTVDWSDFYFG